MKIRNLILCQLTLSVYARVLRLQWLNKHNTWGSIKDIQVIHWCLYKSAKWNCELFMHTLDTWFVSLRCIFKFDVFGIYYIYIYFWICHRFIGVSGNYHQVQLSMYRMYIEYWSISFIEISVQRRCNRWLEKYWTGTRPTPIFSFLRPCLVIFQFDWFYSMQKYTPYCPMSLLISVLEWIILGCFTVNV